MNSHSKPAIIYIDRKGRVRSSITGRGHARAAYATVHAHAHAHMLVQEKLF